MLGQIKEREVSEVKPLIAKHPTGFPKPGSRGSSSRPLAAPNHGKLKRVGELAKKPSDVSPRGSASSSLEGLVSGSGGGARQSNQEVEEEDFQQGNRERVQGMSKSEVEDAMQEIGSMISPKNLALMKKRLEAKQAQAASTRKKGVSFEEKASKKKKEKEKECPSVYDITTMPPHIASSMDELHSIKQRAPAYVKARIAWTGDASDTVHEDDEADEDDRSTNKQATPDDVKLALVRTMQNERFDLHGRKIVNVDQICKELHGALKALGLSVTGQKRLALLIVDGVMGSSKGRAVRLARDVTTVIIEDERGGSGSSGGSSGGSGWGDLSSTTSPQHPLLQHERAPHSPGFTLEETMDLLRSQETHQRSMALGLVEGVLRWRDAVASLETFKCPVPSSILSLSADKGCNTAHSDTTTTALQGMFKSLLCETIILLHEEGYSPHCDTADSEDLADIRRILVHALLLFVTSDFPSTLPFVLRWLCVPMGQRHGSWYSKHLAFKALDSYLFSADEEDTADLLWCGYNGVYSTFPLLLYF